MAAAVQNEKGMTQSYWTVLRIIEMTFEWTAEYMFAFNLYEHRLKAFRQAAALKPVEQ